MSRKFVPYARRDDSDYARKGVPSGMAVWRIIVGAGGSTYWAYGPESMATFTVVTGAKRMPPSAKVEERLRPVIIQAIQAARRAVTWHV